MKVKEFLELLEPEDLSIDDLTIDQKIYELSEKTEYTKDELFLVIKYQRQIDLLRRLK